MARSQQQAIEMFMSITGASEGSALQKLEEHGGDLNEAVNAYFNEGEIGITQPVPVPVPQNDMMDVDDPIEVEPREHPRRLFPTGTNLNPYSLLDPGFVRSFFDGRGAVVSSQVPRVSHPRDVREIPIEFKDGDGQSRRAGARPTIEDISGSEYVHGPEIHGNVIIDDDDDDDLPSTAHATQASGQREREGGVSVDDFQWRHPGPSAPRLHARADYGTEIEEEMLQAAIEASKREATESYHRTQFIDLDYSSDTELEQRPLPSEDVELARAVSLSLKTAEQEKALREHGLIEITEQGVISHTEQLGRLTPNGRHGFDSSNKETSRRIKLEAGDPSIKVEGEDIEKQPLVRQRSRRFAPVVAESVQEVGQMLDSSQSSPGLHGILGQVQHNANVFHEWGDISSVEHDEAVMLEAAHFGRIPEGTAYRFGSQTGGLYPRPGARPPSPALTAHRLLREQQNDEYLASLQADKEREIKAIQEAELRRLEVVAAREAALEQERLRMEEARQKLHEEEEFERQLAAKEASLPQEPAPDNQSAITLLVRMPDGSRRGRRFLKSDRLQLLFDFIDVGRGVKPGTYKLVRPYPRRAFGEGESGLSLSELGLTSKQEALFLELI